MGVQTLSLHETGAVSRHWAVAELVFFDNVECIHPGTSATGMLRCKRSRWSDYVYTTIGEAAAPKYLHGFKQPFFWNQASGQFPVAGTASASGEAVRTSLKGRC